VSAPISDSISIEATTRAVELVNSSGLDLGRRRAPTPGSLPRLFSASSRNRSSAGRPRGGEPTAVGELLRIQLLGGE